MNLHKNFTIFCDKVIGLSGLLLKQLRLSDSYSRYCLTLQAGTRKISITAKVQHVTSFATR